MIVKNVRWLTVALVTLPLVLVGCSKDSSKKKQDCGSADACVINQDCPVGQVCDKTAGCCIDFGCTADSCPLGTFCDPDTQSCKDATEKCNATGCSCNIVNAVGELEASGQAPTIRLAPGASFKLRAVLAVANNGTPVPGVSFTYNLDASTYFDISGDTLTAKPGATSGNAIVTANPGNAAWSCTANLVNLGDSPTGGQVRFMVVDSLNGEPLANAKLVVDSNGDGTDDGFGGLLGSTNTDGLATTTVAPGANYQVTVFKNGYNYLSLVGLNAATQPDIVLPLAPRKTPPVTGGFTGKIDYTKYIKLVLGNQPQTISFGMVASSFSLQSLLNFDSDLFVGEVTSEDCGTVPTPAGCYNVNVPGVVDNTLAALPGGLLLSLPTSSIKPSFDSVASPGRRFAWSLGGQTEISQLTPLINMITPFLSSCTCDTDAAGPDTCDADGGGICSCDFDCGFDFGGVFNALVPLFSGFASGVRGNLALTESPRTDWRQYVTPSYDLRTPDPRFPILDSGVGQYGKLELVQPLTVYTNFHMPALPDDPAYDNATDARKMEGSLVLYGVNTVGYGFVPLGLGAGLDCTVGDCLDRVANASAFDGTINGGTICNFDPDPEKNRCPSGVSGTVSDGHLGLFRATPHSGLENQEELYILLSFPISSFSSDEFGFRAAAMVRHGAITAQNSEEFFSRSYLNFPAMPSAVTGRQYVVPAGTGADVHWVAFAGDEDGNGVTTRWNVYVGSGGGTFVAPQLPVGFTGDPMAGVVETGMVDATHIGFKLRTAVALAQFAANNGTTIADIVQDLDSFTVQHKVDITP